MGEKGVKSESSLYIKGSVAPFSSRERTEDMYDIVKPGRQLEQIDTTDRWSGREDISIEAERIKTLDIQEKLDKQVEDENQGITPIRKGLPPCKRVKREG